MEMDLLPKFVAIDGRNGETPVAQYSYQCTRAYVCLDSLYGACQHESEDIPEDVPVFDFTHQMFPSSGISQNITHSGTYCGGTSLTEMTTMVTDGTVNDAYNAKYRTLQVPLFILEDQVVINRK